MLYFLSEDEETIGLVKAKTVWYIMLRALREKVVYGFNASRRRPQQNIEECITSCRRRFDEIQEWLLFSSSFLNRWKVGKRVFIIFILKDKKKLSTVHQFDLSCRQNLMLIFVRGEPSKCKKRG